MSLPLQTPKTPKPDLSTRAELQRYETSVADEPDCVLEPDLYTDAVVSCLRVPVGFETSLFRDWVARLIPVIAMVVVATVQLVVTYSIIVHVWHALLNARWNVLDHAIESFVGTNSTLPRGLADSVCGAYDQHAITGGTMDSVVMPDGTIFTHNAHHPLWSAVKLPADSWDPHATGAGRSLLDEARFVIEEGWTGFFGSVGYNPLFIVIVTSWYLTMIVEFRHISSFATMLWCVKIAAADEDRFVMVSDGHGKFRVRRMTRSAKGIGLLCVILRLTIATFLLYCGSYFLLFTTTKFELIMTSLAMLFVLNLDNIVYTAIVSKIKQKFLQDVLPVSYRTPDLFGSSAASSLEILTPALVIACCIVGSVGLRIYQVGLFQEFYSDTSALCLFGGPTPGNRPDLVAPVQGFCESLLTMSCGPSAVGPGALRGPCVITDQGTFKEWPASYKFYADSGLFEGMTDDGTGHRRSFRDWGPPQKGLYDSYRTTNVLRKVCLQLWHSGPASESLDTRVVNSDNGEVMQGAPFYCQRATIFDAVFGETRPSPRIKGSTSVTWPEGRIASLESDRAAVAIDMCGSSTTLSLVAVSSSPLNARAIAPASSQLSRKGLRHGLRPPPRNKKNKPSALVALAET